jgi:uncharacterized damage-inducible protein DinB
MKKLLLCISILAGLSFMPVSDTVSKKEKKSATKFLKETEDGVLQSIKGLSEAQLKFKPAEDKWSVEDCMKHIAATEMGLWKMTEGTIAQASNPEKRADIKMTDEEVMKNIEDRTNKVKTFTPFEPQNTGFKTMEEAVASFKENRGKLIGYIKGTDADLRNHVATLPVGSFDCYQMILFIGAHSNRHMKQMEEVKADPNFPKN